MAAQTSEQNRVVSKFEIRKAIAKMILPILISSVLEMFVGIISMKLIGNLGFIAIGAMGLSTRVRGIIWAVYKGIAIGLQVVIAQAYGAGDHTRIKEALRQTIGSIFVVSILFLATMLFAPEFWLKIFGAKGELLDVSADVLRVVGIGMPFLGIILIVSGALQGRGDAITPMIISGIMNLLNIIFGLILVRGWFGFPELGLMGAAIALAFSQAVAALIAFLAIKCHLIDSCHSYLWGCFICGVSTGSSSGKHRLYASCRFSSCGDSFYR